MAVSSKRAEHISLFALIVSVVFFVMALLLGRWSGFFAVWATGWLLLEASLIWGVLALEFHQQSMAEQEKLDMAQFVQNGQTSTIFETKEAHPGLFNAARQRLLLFEKWFLPIFSVVIAVYQIGIGIYLLKALSQPIYAEQQQPLVCAAYMTVIAFISFLVSRYSTALSATEETSTFKPLRAGGSIMLAAALVCFAMAVSLTLAQFKFFAPINVLGYIIGIVLLVVGIETGLNVVFDIYRPRVKGGYNRSAFDSRLLGIINEPGGILHSAASAIDYQFGFKVSQTWFYRLLEKAVVPLVLFGSAVLYLSSSIVIVGPNEQAIVEHFGNPLQSDGQVRALGPGITFKLPWPIDIVRKYPTKEVVELHIGYVPEEYEPGEARKPLIWGKAHHEEEYHLLVASRTTGYVDDDTAVPVSILIAAVPVQYKVKDLYSFLYNYTHPEKLLEAICYRELTRLAANSLIEVDSKQALEQNLLGAGRSKASQILTERIQAAADNEGLGIEIVFLGLQGLHPPVKVAAAYQKVVGAVQEKQAIVLEAVGEKNKILSELAGSVEQAEKLFVLAADYQEAKEKKQTARAEKLASELDKAFAQAKGSIFTTLRESQSYAFKKTTLAKATGQRFASQIKAYEASPKTYKRRQRLAAFEEVLGKIRKYVVVADKDDTQIFIFDAKEKLTPGLYDIAGIEESQRK